MNEYNYLVGQKYEFEDGCSMYVKQIKIREDGPWVTFETRTGPGIPKRGVMPLADFLRDYSHLFPNKP
jgi:hypothetical protein